MKIKNLLVAISLVAASANAAPDPLGDLEKTADAFVKANVMCSHGQAYVAVTGRQGGIAQLSYKPFTVQELASTASSAITCDTRGYILRGSVLSNFDLAIYASGLTPDEVDRARVLADAVPLGKGMVIKDSEGCAWWVKESKGKVTSSRFNMSDGSALCELSSQAEVSASPR